MAPTESPKSPNTSSSETTHTQTEQVKTDTEQHSDPSVIENAEKSIEQYISDQNREGQPSSGL